MAANLIGPIDGWLGSRVESAIRRHHRRRLRRADRLAQLDPPADGAAPYAAGNPPPRAGNEIEVLIDGAQALPALEAAVTAAGAGVDIAGWDLAPGFGLTRDAGARRLRDLLGDVAERVPVRVLLWAGAPLPLFHPTRAAVQRVRAELMRGTRVRCALDAHERPLHCHHEKIAIIDGEVGFVGGIDLTALGGDRFDSNDHLRRDGIGWHDVATRLRGPVVGDLAAHFCARWRAVTGETLDALPRPAAAGPHEAQLLRTVPERVYDFLPRGDFRILESYTRALHAAEHLIYLESQFLWSPELVAILVSKLRDPPNDDFRLVVLLPAHPNNGADSTHGQLGVLAAADRGDRFLASTIVSRTGGLAGPLYVHAKVGIVDDRWLAIGSANLNDHSLFNDTEVCIATCDPRLARDTRLRLWSEHLERPIADVDGDPAAVVDRLWRPIAVEQLARRRRNCAPTHRLQALPGVSRRSRALLGPLDGLVVDA